MSVNDTFAGETHSFLYDASYRVSSNTQGTRGTITYTYDPADRVQTYTVSGGGPAATYTYYDDGSLKTVQWSPVAGTFTYNYTLNGQYSSIVFPNNQQRNYAFDDQGRLTQIVNTHPTPGNLATYAYGYDIDNTTGLATMLGQRTSMTATVPSQSFNNHQTKYYYDGNYQLTRADYPNVAPFNAEIDQWAYDLIGNRTQSIVNGAPTNYTYYKNGSNPNNGQRLQSDGVNTYTYDNNGNMITKSGAGGNFTFTYDYENRLIAISGTTTASYTYDYMGRRSSKNVGSTTTYIYDGKDLIAERGAASADFVFGPRIDEPLGMRRNTSTYFFDVDGLGSINLINNNTGTVMNKYVYEAWGKVRSQTLGISNSFGFTAREFSEAGLVYFRARYLHPEIGRLNREDSFRWVTGINFYIYVLNSPMHMIDPTGLDVVGAGVEMEAGNNGPTAEGSCVIVVDDSWNVALVEKNSIGGGVPGIGVGVVFEYDTGDVCSTEGWSGKIGAGGGEIIDLGLDLSVGDDSFGTSLEVSSGASLMPIDVHGGLEHGKILACANVKKFLQYTKRWLEHPFPIHPIQDWSSCICKDKKKE